MKRAISHILISVLLFISLFSLASCAKNKSDESDKLKYYCTFDNIFTEMIEKYNKYCLKNYDESYQIEIIKFENESDMTTKISTEIMTGGGPDIVSLDQKLPFEKLIDNNSFADIDEMMKQYDCDLDFRNYNPTVMNCGVYNGKRFVIPIFYSPNIFITTQEILGDYNFSGGILDFEKLWSGVEKNNSEYSLFGDKKLNSRLMYYFINQYVDFQNKEFDFKSQEFSNELDFIYKLLKNDNTDENVYYSVVGNDVCMFSTPQSMFGGSIQSMSSCCYYINSSGKTPVIVPNYNKTYEAYVQCGFAVNDKSNKKDKILAFAEYVLSEDVQKYWCGISENKEFGGTNVLALPVNNVAFEDSITYAEQNNNDEESLDIADTKMLKDYLEIINNIDDCMIYNYADYEETYYNSSVIGEIVNKYLAGDISKELFISQITSATEFYLTE